MCSFEKHIENFYKKFAECKECNSKRGWKRYYDNKEKLSNQRKTFYEKNKDKILQLQNDNFIPFKDLVGYCIELDIRLKVTEEILKNVSQ